LLEPLASMQRAQRNATQRIAALPPALRSLNEGAPYEISISPRLLELAESVRSEHQLERA
jgi:hypothetical protein